MKKVRCLRSFWTRFKDLFRNKKKSVSDVADNTATTTEGNIDSTDVHKPVAEYSLAGVSSNYSRVFEDSSITSDTQRVLLNQLSPDSGKQRKFALFTKIDDEVRFQKVVENSAKKNGSSIRKADTMVVDSQDKCRTMSLSSEELRREAGAAHNNSSDSHCNVKSEAINIKSKSYDRVADATHTSSNTEIGLKDENALLDEVMPLDEGIPKATKINGGERSDTDIIMEIESRIKSSILFIDNNVNNICQVPTPMERNQQSSVLNSDNKLTTGEYLDEDNRGLQKLSDDTHNERVLKWICESEFEKYAQRPSEYSDKEIEVCGLKEPLADEQLGPILDQKVYLMEEPSEKIPNKVYHSHNWLRKLFLPFCKKLSDNTQNERVLKWICESEFEIYVQSTYEHSDKEIEVCGLKEPLADEQLGPILDQKVYVMEEPSEEIPNKVYHSHNWLRKLFLPFCKKLSDNTQNERVLKWICESEFEKYVQSTYEYSDEEIEVCGLADEQLGPILDRKVYLMEEPSEKIPNKVHGSHDWLSKLFHRFCNKLCCRGRESQNRSEEFEMEVQTKRCEIEVNTNGDFCQLKNERKSHHCSASPFEIYGKEETQEDDKFYRKVRREVFLEGKKPHTEIGSTEERRCCQKGLSGNKPQRRMHKSRRISETELLIMNMGKYIDYMDTPDYKIFQSDVFE